MTKAFPCSGCGLCCKTAGLAVSVARKLVSEGNQAKDVQEIAAFPYQCSPEGRCEKLDEHNRCSVYENRPDICSVEKTHAKHHSSVSQENYFQLAASICNSMMAKEGVDPKFHLKTTI